MPTYKLEAQFNSRFSPVGDESYTSFDRLWLCQLARSMFADYPNGEYTLVEPDGLRTSLVITTQLTWNGRRELRATPDSWVGQRDLPPGKANYRWIPEPPPIGLQRFLVPKILKSN